MFSLFNCIIKNNSFLAVIGSLIVVFLYILFRFLKWQFSLGAVVAVFHDVLIVLGIFSLTYKFMPFSMEINQAFIAAFGIRRAHRDFWTAFQVNHRGDVCADVDILGYRASKTCAIACFFGQDQTFRAYGQVNFCASLNTINGITRQGVPATDMTLGATIGNLVH